MFWTKLHDSSNYLLNGADYRPAVTAVLCVRDRVFTRLCEFRPNDEQTIRGESLQNECQADVCVYVVDVHGVVFFFFWSKGREEAAVILSITALVFNAYKW